MKSLHLASEWSGSIAEIISVKALEIQEALGNWKHWEARRHNLIIIQSHSLNYLSSKVFEHYLKFQKIIIVKPNHEFMTMRTSEYNKRRNTIQQNYTYSKKAIKHLQVPLLLA